MILTALKVSLHSTPTTSGCIYKLAYQPYTPYRRLIPTTIHMLWLFAQIVARDAAQSRVHCALQLTPDLTLGGAWHYQTVATFHLCSHRGATHWRLTTINSINYPRITFCAVLHRTSIHTGCSQCVSLRRKLCTVSSTSTRQAHSRALPASQYQTDAVKYDYNPNPTRTVSWPL